MEQTPRVDSLDRALADLARALGEVDFALSGDDRAAREGARDRLARDVAGHRARLRDLEAPLLVVLGGVTGAGKSTVVNSLLGRAAVATGVLRPTTYDPALVANPADAGWFTGERVLAGLARVQPRGGRAGAPGEGGRQAAGGRGSGRRAGTLALLLDHNLPRGLALVDAPDVDSIGQGNRDLADRLLDAADLWLWFTTVGKYADEESMRYLRRAAARDTALAVVLTQVQPADAQVVVEDFRRKLIAAGIPADAPLLVVPHTTVTDERLPPAAIAPLRDWLRGLADPVRRREQRRRTLDGALDALAAEVAPLVAALEDEGRTATALRDEAHRAYEGAEREFAAALEQGLPLRQEVLANWERYVGTNRFLRLAEQATGQARDWIRGVAAGPVDPRERRLERETRVEVAGTLSGLVTQLVDLAATGTAAEWGRTGVGRDLLAAHPDLGHRAPDLAGRAEREVLAWQDEVVHLVETVGAERRNNARLASTAVTGVAAAALLVVLGATAGLTGAEVGIAAGAAAAQQALLVKLLGAGNLRWLIEQSRARLTERFADLAAEDRARYEAALAAADPAAVAARLREALSGVLATRRTPLPGGPGPAGALPPRTDVRQGPVRALPEPPRALPSPADGPPPAGGLTGPDPAPLEADGRQGATAAAAPPGAPATRPERPGGLA